MKTFIIATLLTLVTFTANAQVHGSASGSIDGGANYAPPASSSSMQQGNSVTTNSWNGHSSSSATIYDSSNNSGWTLVVITGTRRSSFSVTGVGSAATPAFDNVTINRTPGYAFDQLCTKAAKLAKARGVFTMDAYCIPSP